LPFEEIFSDNYSTEGPQLLSKHQAKTLSQQLLKKKGKE